jgi:hypothetical protein
MSAHRKQRRRVIDHLQALRIAGLADGDECHAKLLRRFDLALGRFARINLRRRGATTPRQRGQRLKRGASAAEMIDKGAKRARSRYYGANAGVCAIIPRGPTFWLRMRRSQSRRCSSVRWMLCTGLFIFLACLAALELDGVALEEI